MAFALQCITKFNSCLGLIGISCTYGTVEAQFEVSMVGEESVPKGDNVQINITHQAQGMYLVQYMTTHAMVYRANVSLDGRSIMDSPFELEVLPGPVYPYGCYAEGTMIMCTPSPLFFLVKGSVVNGGLVLSSQEMD